MGRLILNRGDRISQMENKSTKFVPDPCLILHFSTRTRRDPQSGFKIVFKNVFKMVIFVFGRVALEARHFLALGISWHWQFSRCVFVAGTNASDDRLVCYSWDFLDIPNHRGGFVFCCFCAVLVLFLFCSCAVFVLFLWCVFFVCCVCVVFVLFLCCICFVFVCCVCVVFVLYLFCFYAVFVFFTYIVDLVWIGFG